MQQTLVTYGLVAVCLAVAPQTPRPVKLLNLTWSPDGRQLAFESDAGGRFAIYVIGADGTELRRLTGGSANDVQPAWSHDGASIVFTSDRDGHDQLYEMKADGSNTHRVAVSDTNDFYASLSPDDAVILFSAQDRSDPRRFFVGVIGRDGSQRRLLTDGTASSEGPRWTHDGRHISFSRVPLLSRLTGESIRDFVLRRDTATETMLMTPDGSVVTALRNAGAGDTPSDPSRSADGRLVAAPDVGAPGSITITDARSGQVLRRLHGPGHGLVYLHD